MNEIEKTPEYFAWIGELKKRYRSTQIKASVSVNSALLEFYWLLGKDIGERYPASKLGNQFYKILSADLKMDIPNASGLSPSSLKYSGYFYKLYSKLWIGQQVADLHIEPSQQPADSDNLNTHQENPAIGLFVCRSKNEPLAKYLLGKIDMPIGVSDYELLRKVPDDFKSQLPTIEEIEAELANMEKEPGK